MEDFRAESYRKRAKEQSESKYSSVGLGSVSIHPDDIVTSDVPGVDQVAIRGSAGAVVFTSYQPADAEPVASTTPALPEATPISPEIKQVFTGQTEVQVSHPVAEKLFQQSLRKDYQYSVIVDRPPKPTELPASVDTELQKQLEEKNKKKEANKKKLTEVYQASPIYPLWEGIKYAFSNPSKGIKEEDLGKQGLQVEGFSNILLAGGTGMTSLNFGSAQIAKHTVKEEYVKPLKQKMSKEPIITPEAVSEERSLAISATRKLKKQGVPNPEEHLPALSVRPIEDFQGISKTVSNKGIAMQDSFIMVRKGKPEIIKSLSELDISESAIISYTKDSTNLRLSKPNIINPRIEENTLRIGKGETGNLKDYGPPSRTTYPSMQKSEQVKSVISIDELNKQLNPRMEIIKLDRVAGRRVTVENQNAIFKGQSLIGKTNNKALYNKIDEQVSGSITGFQENSKESGSYNFGFKRITREKNILYDQGLQDMRFWIGNDNKPVIPFEGSLTFSFPNGKITKLYSFDKIGEVATIVRPDNKAVFSSVIVNIPKPEKVNAQVFGAASSGSQESVLISLETVKVETGLSTKVSTDSLVSKGKKKTRQQYFTDQSYEPGGEPPKKVYRQYYSEPSQRFVNKESYIDISGTSKSYPVFLPGIRNKNSVLGGYGKVDSLAKSSPKLEVSSVLASAQIPGVSQKQFVGQMTGQASATNSFTSQRYDFKRLINRRSDHDSEEEKNRKRRKLKFPDIDFDSKDYGFEYRRRGEFLKGSQGLSLSEAIKLGKLKVQNTAAATFRVTKNREPIKVNPPKGFYSRGNLLIEPRDLRIKSSGEIAEISLAGIRSNRRRGVF